jgi:hypothetical protein
MSDSPDLILGNKWLAFIDTYRASKDCDTVYIGRYFVKYRSSPEDNYLRIVTGYLSNHT